MIQPILSAINAWLGLYSELPFAITALIGLAGILFLLSRILVITFNAR